MKKYAYTVIPLVVLAGPLALSFDRKVNFIRYWPSVALATVVVGAVYIIWDIWVTRRGHWRFNDEFVGDSRLLELPVGEWLFFLCVPYATLFIYEVAEAYFGPGEWTRGTYWWQIAASVPFFVSAWFLRRREYTALAFGSTGLFLLVSAAAAPGLLANLVFWIFTALSLVAFAIVNGVYTSLPTIVYNREMIIGPKIGSIPLEDFFYNMSYLGLTLLVYLLSKGVLGIAAAPG